MTTIENTLAERGKRYGDFTDHADIAQSIQDDMRAAEGWKRLTRVQRQALTVIADKIARILSGDPNYADNWHDIQGYARLAEERLPGPGKPANDNSAAEIRDFMMRHARQKAEAGMVTGNGLTIKPDPVAFPTAEQVRQAAEPRCKCGLYAASYCKHGAGCNDG